MKSGKMLTKVQRRRQRRMRRAAVFAAVGLAVGVVPSVSPFGDDGGEAYAAANVPPGFSDSLVAGGFLLPTVVDFLPDGRMLVADKGGFIHVVQNGAVLPTPLIDLSSKVSDNWDRGLLGMAVDPDFATTGHLFLLYVFQDPQPDDVPKKTLRLTRITVTGNTASPASEVVLIGNLTSPGCQATLGNPDCIPIDYFSHGPGSIVFAPDKTLFFAVGDGASFDEVDDLALRAQDLDQYSGKILRVDRDGNGVPSNPHWNGDPDSIRSRVYARGLRNPFRFTLRPGTMTLQIGDVGWYIYEELNVGGAGANFGWPCYEGAAPQPDYQPKSVCQALYAQGPGAVTAPFHAWEHINFGTAAAVGGPSASLTNFPAPWNQGIFFSDYANGWIRYAPLTAGGASAGAPVDFATNVDAAVELKIGPDGALYYIAIGSGEIRKIAVGEAPPSEGTTFLSSLTPISAANGWGPYENDESNGEFGGGDGNPLTIGGATYVRGLGVHAASELVFAVPSGCRLEATVGVDDEVGDAGSVVFQVWDGTNQLFDSGVKTGADGPSAVSLDLTGVGAVRLVVTDAGDGAAFDHGDWGNARFECGAVGGVPSPVISTPTVESRFGVGDLVSFSGSATDPEDGVLPPSALTWIVTIHHCPNGECHDHFLKTEQGAGGQFELPDHGDDVYYTVDLRATDSAGQTTTVSRRVEYRTSKVTLTSNPSGLSLTYGLETVVTPFTIDVAEGSVRTIGAASQGTSVFNGWADGGAAIKDVTVGAADATYTANFTSSGSTVFVSDLSPSVAAVNGWGPVEKDKSNAEQAGGDGKTLTLNGVTYVKGLGVHASSDVRYSVPSGCTSLTGVVGVDDEVGANGTVVFQVWSGTTTKLYDSGVKTGSAPGTAFSVGLAGVSTLRLVVTDGGDGQAYDHGDWADLKLVCGAPPVDGVPPVVSGVSTSGVSATGVTIGWTTNEASSTQIEYGTTTGYGSTTVLDPAMVTAHSQSISGLAASTTYNFRVLSRDAANNLGVSANGTFTTAAAPSGSTVFVSDLSPSVAAVNGWGPVEKDKSNAEQAGGDGKTLTLNGVTYVKGLGVHASSDVRYSVPSGCTSLTGVVGVDDEVGANGTVVFQVWSGTTTKLYDSGVKTGSAPGTAFSVGLAGVSTLRLVVTDGGDGQAYDHGDWADLKLICGV